MLMGNTHFRNCRKLVCRGAVLAGLALTIIEPAAGGEIPAHKSAQKSLVGEDLFKDGYIPVLQIQINEAGINSLRRSPRKYVRATVREGAGVYTNVAIHLKGGPGSFRGVDDTPAFTLNFERFAEGQRFHGLKKIHLNNSVQDRTYLSEKISRELFEAAGVPAPRAGNAAVEFNGDALGIYVLVEGIGKQFLRRYFKETTGNVYDGHSQMDVTRVMPTNFGENRRDQSHLRALAAAAQEPDLNRRLARLEQTLDVDRFISFVAMEVMLWHWDGYTMNRNNFRIYDDRDAGRMVFLPQGLDQILRQPDGPLFPPMNGLVTRAVLEIPELRGRYRERMAQLLTNVFKVQVVTNRLYELAGKIEAVIEKFDPQEKAIHRARVTQLCRHFQRRANSIERQLFSQGNASRFDKAGIMAVTDWRPQVDFGTTNLTREQETAGKVLLHISVKEPSSASWRSRVLLDIGQYRLVAKAKTEGVVLSSEDPRGGAGLRISRRKFSQKLSGDTDWSRVTFDFDVAKDQSDVELVCELRAMQGDIWFDLKSFRLIRRIADE